MRFPVIAVCVTATLVVSGGCRKEPPAGEPPVTSETAPVPHVPLAVVPPRIAGAPLQVSSGAARYQLGVQLWREFMPSALPEGRPLAAAVWLRARNATSSVVPEIDSLWVVRGDSAWAVRLEKEGGAESDTIVGRYRASGGPLWGPGISADVVVRLIPARGAPLFLRTPGVAIARTD